MHITQGYFRLQIYPLLDQSSYIVPCNLRWFDGYSPPLYMVFSTFFHISVVSIFFLLSNPLSTSKQHGLYLAVQVNRGAGRPPISENRTIFTFFLCFLGDNRGYLFSLRLLYVGSCECFIHFF